MADWNDVHARATAMPQVTVGDKRGQRFWCVAGTTFAWERPLGRSDTRALGDAAPTGDVLAVRTSDLLVRDAIVAQAEPGVFVSAHFLGYPAVLLDLPQVAPDLLEELLQDAWLACAPAEVAADWQAADPELHDIADREDIRRLATSFYERVFRDELLGPVFVDVAKMDLESHLPVICDFWETLLLGAKSYRGGAFAPHARLNGKVPLRAQHFRRWLAIWCATVDDLFAGDVADAAKARAEATANAFHSRLTEPDPGPMWVDVRRD